jgi:putative transcriptional regulator
MARHSAEYVRRQARVDRKALAAATESDIARHAVEDGSADAVTAFEKARAEGRIRTVTPLDVAAIRAKTGLSQDRFARAFRISPHTLRNWEQGRRVPDGPACALLLAIDRDPEALMRALEA